MEKKNKPLSFKDFLSVDYTPGMPDQISKNAKQRKTANEALSFSQRQARGRMMKKIKSKLKIGRAKAAKRAATPEVLTGRAQKAVRNVFFKKFSKGKGRTELPPARRAEIEKRISKIPKQRVQNMVKKLIPKIRKAEMERKRGPSSNPEQKGN